MVNRFIKSGLFRGISYFLVFLLSFNAVFLGFAKEASAELVAGPPVVVAASLLIAAGLSFTDTESLQSAVQTFQDTNSEGWALIEAAAGAAYAYGSVYNTVVSDSLWQNVTNYVDANYISGENTIYTNEPFADFIPNYYVPFGVAGAVISSGTAQITINNYHFDAENGYHVWTVVLPASQNTFVSTSASGNEFKSWISDGALYLMCRRAGSVEVYFNGAAGAVAAAGITAGVAAVAGTLTGDAAWLDSVARELDWGPEGPNQEPPQKKIGFPWPLVGATGVSLTLDELLDRLLGEHAPDVKNGGPGISEQPYNPPTVDPENPPLDRPSTDAGWLENIWAQLVAVKTGVLTLSKTVSDFILPPVPVSVNLEPLKLTGVALTNVFPFSLPWDLARSMNPFYTTSSFEPIFNLGPFDMPGVGACTWAINLSNWSAAVTLVRAMELLFFDIGLVLLTRKLMGGAV